MSLDFYIDREKAALIPKSQAYIKGSPGWGRTVLGTDRGKVVVLDYHHESGVRLIDVLSITNDVVEIVVPDTGFSANVYPGAGLALSIVPGMPPVDGSKSPYQVPLIAPGMGYLADHPYTGGHGSARNSMTSFTRDALQPLPDAERWRGPTASHVLRRMEFQRRRGYQNADANGEFSETPAAKTPAESMMIWSPGKGHQIPDPVWKYDALHFSNQEECAVYEMSRDPRAYDLMARMIRHARRWDGYLKGSNPSLYDMSRVKGWWCAALGRAAYAALTAGDAQLLGEIRESIIAALHTIEEQFDRPDRVTPSKQAPSGQHIVGHWSDSSWMIAILAHGLDLIARAVPDLAYRARVLAHRALDVIDEVCWDGTTLYMDVTAAGDHREVWKPYTKGDGTAKWIAQAMIQCGRLDSPALKWIEDWRAANHAERVTWDDYLLGVGE